MQPSSREMQGMAASLNDLSSSAAAQIALHDLQDVHSQQNFDHSAAGGGGHDDFFDQMLSGLPGPWSELEDTSAVAHKLFNIGLSGKSAEEAAGTAEGLQFGAPNGESSLLTSRLRQHQISGGGSSPTGKQMMLPLNHQQPLLQGVRRPPTSASGEAGLIPVPLTMGGSGGERDEVDASYKSTNSTGSEGFYNGFVGSIPGSAQPQHFHHPQGASMGCQGFGGAPPSAGTGQDASATAAASASASAAGGTAAPRQRVRARRGQATDPHSIAERLRRERIAERMKALQELVPNANKTDKASMLDEIIDYVKFLQLQVKVLSMSRLGGAGAVAPLVADMSSETSVAAAGGRVCLLQRSPEVSTFGPSTSGMARPGANGGAGGSTDSSIVVTEHQVAKLMEEDMGSAMQYLQGKGLCLMPISLASAISSATCHPGPPQPSPATGIAGLLNHGLLSSAHPSNPNAAADGHSSPSVLSVLKAQSAAANGGADADAFRLSGNKDNTRP